MRNMSYRVKGSDCITPCPYNKGVMIGSFACKGCDKHFQQMSGLQQVICSE